MASYYRRQDGKRLKLEIDHQKLVNHLSYRANENASKRATMAGGAIVVTVIDEEEA